MFPLSREQLAACVAPFGEARPLPRAAFVDPRVLDWERRSVFATEWLPVAHEADLARPGSWVRAPVLGEHVVCVRASDLAIVALHATCRHRGTLLLDGERGHLESLVIRCPYHGNTYGTLGQSLSRPGAPEALSACEPGVFDLPRAEVATSAGVVFVRLAAGPVSARSPLEEGPPWLRRAKLGALRRARRVDYEVRANWKLVVGNFQESHHFGPVHPALEARTRASRSSSVVESDRWLGGLMELEDGLETVSESGRAMGRAFVAAPEDRARVSDAFVFPLWLTSLQPDYLLTYRLAPRDVDRTDVVAEIHLAASSPDDARALDDLAVFWDRTNAEDRAICERQQRGLAATSARAGYYASSEDGLHAFERVVASRYLASEGGAPLGGAS